MNDRTAENIPLNNSQKDDLYPDIRRDMSSIFYEHNLDAYTNGIFQTSFL